ncbi:MAG: PhoH family protein, partial [Actinobacteria bacterium]|nr:PhoH family protein [Actinomycetota bacterium]
MRTQLELSNEVATELAGAHDSIMKTLEDHLDCEVYLRGNVLTLDGGEGEVATGETVVREVSDLVRL